MNKEYSEYLLSEAWKVKRNQRLAIAKNRCAACGSGFNLHVHHLTYARIFNEEMPDLLPLCKPHHEIAETLVNLGRLPRSDDVLWLATETVRLVLGWRKSANHEPKGIEQIEARNPTQEWLLGLAWFRKELGNKVRHQFKTRVRRMLKSEAKRAKKTANALTLYDKMWR